MSLNPDTIAKFEEGPNPVKEMTGDMAMVESPCTDQMCSIQYVATHNISLVLKF